jgi:hypothetical protein
MQVEISIGELLDKLSILYIKSKFITDPIKLLNVQKEIRVLEPLSQEFFSSPEIKNLFGELETVNFQLWKIEDDIREKEKSQEFDQEFIDLARAVYFTNDRRAEIKKQINLQTGSNLVEEKSYQNYT